MRTLPTVVAVVLAAAACSGADSDDSAPGPGSTTTSPADDARPTATAAPPQPTTIPDVNLDIHSVPLAEVVFDTFDGSFLRLDESTVADRRRLLDVIPPLDAPGYEAAAEVDWLSDDDLVVGFVAGDQPIAYPVRILNSHEIVNDVLDGIPVLISYCPLCRSAIVYDRRVDGRTLSFSNTSALHDSDLVMVDRETGSYWWQVAGRAIVGELTESALTPLPSELATWADWLERHPATTALSRDTGFDRRYERDNFSRYDERVAAGDFAFPVGEAATDDRLGAADIVIVVTVGDVTVAYPRNGLDGAVTDTVGGVEVVVTPHAAGAAVNRLDDGSPLGTRTAFWFSVAGAFPDVEVRTPTATR